MNTLRIGLVTVQDAGNCRVRVSFPDHDQLQSWWLPIVVAKSQNDKSYHLPDVGEQVVCLMDGHDEDGVVLGAVYSSADVTPAGMTPEKIHWTMKDGASFEYDRSSHALGLAVPAGGSVSIAAGNSNVRIEPGGNVVITTSNQIQLGNGALKGVARLGDSVICPAGSGTIVSASTVVQAE